LWPLCNADTHDKVEKHVDLLLVLQADTKKGGAKAERLNLLAEKI
jgi:hypothetical protein